MADSPQYVTVAGFIQFDPNEKEVNGKQVTEFFVKTLGGDSKNVRITLWPEIEVKKGEEPIKGAFVAVDGKYTSSAYQAQDGSPRTSFQISATHYAYLGVAAPRKDREVVASASASAGTKVPF